MTCDEFENLLQEVLDRRETPSADPFLMPHAKVCAACQRKVALYEALFDGLELVETPALGSDFSSKTSRAATVRRKWNWKRPAGILAALAASLLLVVAFFNRDRGNDQPAGSDNVAESGTTPKPAATESNEKRRKRNSVPTLAPTLAKLPNDRQPPADPEPPATDYGEQLGHEVRAVVAGSLAETARLPGVRPLTSSLGTAFDAIRQTLPGGRAEEPVPNKPQARLMLGDVGRYV